MRVILALNAGSSTLKLALYKVTGDTVSGGETPEKVTADTLSPGETPETVTGYTLLATGLADRIGPEGNLRLTSAEGRALPVAPGPVTSHAEAMARGIETLRRDWPAAEVVAIGHRVVHGGADHSAPAEITENLITDLERLSPLAPLHQPQNIAGIRAAQAAFPGVRQVAVFDTAFHRSHPWVNDTFALPREMYDRGVRRYGFHGLSYDYITGALARVAPHLHDGRVVVAHLGSGASMCAIQGGRSVASTMGFSALDGLPMGTRCGQLDPGVVLYLMQSEGMSADQVAALLYQQSGLLGLSGLSNDMRVLEASATPEAAQAIDYFVFRIQRELGGMAAAMGGIDALVFCGGIGENSRLIRARVCERAGWMGIEIDHGRNARNDLVISSDLARTTVMVMPTVEAEVIVRAALALLEARRPQARSGQALSTRH